MFAANPFGAGFFADGYAGPTVNTVAGSDTAAGADSPSALAGLLGAAETALGIDTGFSATGFAGADTAAGTEAPSMIAAFGSLPPGSGGGGFGCNPFGWGYDGAGYLGTVIVPPSSGPTVDGGTASDAATVAALYTLADLAAGLDTLARIALTAASELATGSDNASVPTAAIPASEAAAGAELALLLFHVVVAETAIGTNSAAAREVALMLEARAGRIAYPHPGTVL